MKKFLTEMRTSARISYRKGVTVKQRSASVICVYQKSNLTLACAVAFLMSFTTSGLPDTDYRNDDTDDRHYNTDKFQNHIEHQWCLPFTLFSTCIPSLDTGSSQNVLILAKGEPLPVLVTPKYILHIITIFCKM